MSLFTNYFDKDQKGSKNSRKKIGRLQFHNNNSSKAMKYFGKNVKNSREFYSPKPRISNYTPKHNDANRYNPKFGAHDKLKNMTSTRLSQTKQTSIKTNPGRNFFSRNSSGSTKNFQKIENFTTSSGSGSLKSIRRKNFFENRIGNFSNHSNGNIARTNVSIESKRFKKRKTNGFVSPHRLRMQKKLNKLNLSQNTTKYQKEEKSLIKLVKRNDEKGCIEILGKGKVNLSEKGENEWTALHFACWIGNFKIVNLLIINGADVDAKAKNNISPLMVASSTGNSKIIELLINAGANLEYVDISGSNPLHYAAQSNSIDAVAILVEKGADVYSINKKKETIEDKTTNRKIKEYLKKFKGKMTGTDENEYFIPIVSYKFDKIKQIFNKEKDLNSTNYTRETLGEPELDRNSSKRKVGPADFDILSLLGKGSFGEVYLVRKKDTGKRYAMKLLQKQKIMRQNLLRYAMTERNVLSYVKHPFIVGLHYAFQTSEKLGLLLDYCPGGDLGKHLQRETRFCEERSRIYLCEIIIAIEDLHRRDIIFRDLKPDNVVLDEEGHLKLTDFGLSKEGVYNQISGAKSFCGSVAYLAPEMLKMAGHGKAVDWYLLGVMLYEMLVSVPPYFASTKEELFRNIESAPLKVPKSLSSECKDLLKKLLQRDPKKRLGSKDGSVEVKNHPFFKDINWNDVYMKKYKMVKPEIYVDELQKPINSTFIFEDNELDLDEVPGWSFVQNDFTDQKHGKINPRRFY